MTARRKYNWDEVIAQIEWWLSEGGCEPTFKALGEHLEMDPRTLGRGLRRLGITAEHLPEMKTPDMTTARAMGVEAALLFKDKKHAEEVPWRELLDLAASHKALISRGSDFQKFANVEIQTDRPIALMFTGDWHLGDYYTDYLYWKRDIEFLLDTPNLFMIDLGDDRQNVRSARNLAMILGQVLQPQQQAWAIRSLIDELTERGKLLAKIGGNHDEEFDERVFGEAIANYLNQKMKAPHFANKGLLKLTVGQVMYTILVFHKSRYRSFIRRCHGNMRMHQLVYPADIVAGAHDHAPGMEHLRHYGLAEEAGMGFGEDTYFIKVGSYQDSKYGWKYFHGGGNPGTYTAVLYPNQRKIAVFPNARDAVQYMKGFEES